MKPESSLSLRLMESGKVIFGLLVALGLSACASVELEQPKTSAVLAAAAAHDLVDVRSIAPDILVDLRYKTSRNVLGRPVYPSQMPCLLKRGTAQKLAKAQELLRKKGLGLKIWDGWRPPEVQSLFYDKHGHTGMFMDPKVMWSRHCTGTSVDVTLVNAKGRELKMPTDHDAEGTGARFDALDAPREVRKNVSMLQNAMFSAGFLLIDIEWWHFDDKEFVFHQPRVVSASDLGLVLPQ
jgi:zinc D-Ala-D-Ala dipeptidase